MADNDKKIMESQHQQRLGIMPKANMDTGNVGTGELLISEILTKVNNAKDKPKKIAVLQEYDSPSLRMILKVHLTLKLNGHYLVVHRLIWLTKHQ